jgi:hypothetical protein
VPQTERSKYTAQYSLHTACSNCMTAVQESPAAAHPVVVTRQPWFAAQYLISAPFICCSAVQLLGSSGPAVLRSTAASMLGN